MFASAHKCMCNIQILQHFTVLYFHFQSFVIFFFLKKDTWTTREFETVFNNLHHSDVKNKQIAAFLHSRWWTYEPGTLAECVSLSATSCSVTDVLRFGKNKVQRLLTRTTAPERRFRNQACPSSALSSPCSRWRAANTHTVSMNFEQIRFIVPRKENETRCQQEPEMTEGSYFVLVVGLQVVPGFWVVLAIPSAIGQEKKYKTVSKSTEPMHSLFAFMKPWTYETSGFFRARRAK